MKRHPILIGAAKDRLDFYRHLPVGEETVVVESLSCLLKRVQFDAWDLLIIACETDVSYGLTLLRQIKPAHPGLPVVVISESVSTEVVLAAFRWGARDYFQKPFNLYDFKACVEYLLRTKRARGERREFMTPQWHRSEPTVLKADAQDIPLNILRSVHFMEAHLEGGINLAVLSLQAGMSKHHYCRTFKASIGMAPLHFFNYLRVQKAKCLLQEKYLSISAVALKSGFSSLNTMNRWFNIFENSSPSCFRRGTHTSPRV